MKLLAIDTSGEGCSAALYIDGQLHELFEQQARQHSKLILGMMDTLLAGAQIKLTDCDALAFGRGPGSFTGVRIAAGVIQGAAFAADLPVVPVSSLRALAQGCFRQNGARHILAIVDARMKEVYAGAYEIGDGDLAAPLADDRLCRPEQLELPQVLSWVACGSGFKEYSEALERQIPTYTLASPDCDLGHAQDVARLAVADAVAGKAVSAVDALPVYLRDKVAEKPKFKNLLRAKQL